MRRRPLLRSATAVLPHAVTGRSTISPTIVTSCRRTAKSDRCGRGEKHGGSPGGVRGGVMSMASLPSVRHIRIADSHATNRPPAPIKEVPFEGDRSGRATKTPQPPTGRGSQRLELLAWNARRTIAPAWARTSSTTNPTIRGMRSPGVTLQNRRRRPGDSFIARCVNAGTRTVKRRPIPGLHLDPLQATKGARVPDRIQERIEIVRDGPRFDPVRHSASAPRPGTSPPAGPTRWLEETPTRR